ncbi:hypothetical protein HN911_13235 [Candidatus Bathyarchaeota archaeon]|jgi:hypothetical protein|nr:hypothetical protein [Candidatus Bathyarchaeota archaeon]
MRSCPGTGLAAKGYRDVPPEPEPQPARTSGLATAGKSPIAGKAIVAAVTYNPKAVYDPKPPPADLDAAFSKRYLLVTPDNVGQMAYQYGDLFKK